MKLIENNHGRMNIFLCEDNEEHLYQLSETIRQVAAKKDWDVFLSTFLTADDLLENLKMQKAAVPDIIFADIELPGINGIELGKRMKHSYPECYFIFTTAFEEYAVQGYEARAYSYLLKPITSQDVRRTLEQIFREKGRKRSVLLKEQGVEVPVSLKDIIYISAEDKYTIFYTCETFYLDKISLKECEKLLCRYGFYRIHRKYLVNMSHHKGFGKGVVVLSGSIRLPISRSREEDYHKCFMELLEEGMLG